MPSPTRRYYSSTAVAATLSASLTSSATSIAISTVTGWPASYPFTAIIGEDTNKEELVTVTGVAGTTLTITRGVGGTTGQAHDAGETIRHGVYAQDFEDGAAHYAASTAVHGVAGSVVGTSDTQTLTNKTISGSSNTLSAIPSASVTGLDTHTASTTAHGATGAVVGTTNTQTLTNKTISGASNTLSAIPSASVTGLDTHTASTTAHGATGAVVGTTNTQTLTNKTISGSSNTLSNVSWSAIDGTYGLVAAGTGVACADNTWTLITFDTQIALSGYDVHSTSTNPSRLKVPTGKSGMYIINAVITFPANATNVRRLQVRLNSAGSATGGTLVGSTGIAAIATSGVTTSVVYSRIVYLTAGDYVELFGIQNSGGSLTTSTGESNTSFSINRVG